MNKRQTMAFLNKLQSKGIKLGLGRIKKFLAFAGNPERQFKVVHVAGTNGKGSTAAMIESILQEAGYKTGLYTSPHLVNFNERFRVNGKDISDRTLLVLVKETRKQVKKSDVDLTYFEFVTAMAFKHFAKQKVEIAVIEVGLGGRLDATNMVNPVLSVITNVEREHEERLGVSFVEIAGEKAGIIKKGKPVVTAEWKESVLRVFRKKCREKNAPLYIVKKPFSKKIGLSGSFQKWNAALAVKAIGLLNEGDFKISDKAVAKGLLKVKWPGRFQIVKKKPVVIVDCAHNPACCIVLAKSFREKFPGKKALLVVGISEDKRVKKMAAALAPIAGKVFVSGAGYKPMTLDKVAKAFSEQGFEVEVAFSVKKAVEAAFSAAKKADIVLVTGSCFVVGEALQLFSA